MRLCGLLLFSAALSFGFQTAVNQDGATLRSGCEPGDAALASLPAGNPIQIQFSISGACYKIATTVGGKAIEGYLPAGALTGLEEFVTARQNAPALEFSEAMTSKVDAIRSMSGQAPGGNPLAKASQLLQSRQARAALEVAESAMKTSGRNYELLLLAGIAAYQTDDATRALDYFRQAGSQKQDHLVEQWIARLEKEVAGDKSGERLYGNRFILRYEGGTLDAGSARNMVAVLEEEFARMATLLGCRTEDRVVVVVQSKEAYRASTDAAEWSGGQFDGSKIRVPVMEAKGFTAGARRALSHEVVHVCLAGLGDWPVWFHEGMAQKLSGDTVSSSQRALLRTMFRQGRMPKLQSMSQSWSRMSPQHASLAYAHALLAVDLMMDRYAAYGIQNILRNPERLPAIAADLDTILQQ